ncbi:MAG: leucine-rich repeat domain-containing protein, partial [Sedimentisphaerales bacterium]|nr:leucine-rich repeat domain-containing protein [Sedimentisphaerales bacterium]
MSKASLAGWILVLGVLQCGAMPVAFEDPALKSAVEAAIGIPDPGPEEMLGLSELRASKAGIRSISGLEYALNLRELDLSYNRIVDIRPLAGLTCLISLELYNNLIQDFGPIAGLSNLRRLDIHFNPAKDLSFLMGLSRLEYLVIHNMDLTDIGALSSVGSLTSLDIYGNQIQDLSPLATLTSLECLYAGSNPIVDITALAGLKRLRTLSLSCAQVSDLSPIAGLLWLESLNLFGNKISDISALAGLRSLKMLNIWSNPLDGQACAVYLPIIRANNPGLILYEDQCQHRPSLRLVVTCGPGGEVLSPGAGTFVYEDGHVIYLQAHAKEGFAFLRWTGTIESRDNPFKLVMDRDHQICAEFVPFQQVVYVDDDAVGDLGPNDILVSDPLEDGSWEHPYDSIQEAVWVVRSGGKVVVRPGVYFESVDCLGKDVRMEGYDVNGCSLDMYPVIIGSGLDFVVRVGGGEGVSELRGFIIGGGYGGGGSLVEVVGGRCLI